MNFCHTLIKQFLFKPLFFLFIMHTATTATTQTPRRATGFVFNTPQYQQAVKQQKLDGIDGQKFRMLPLQVSLRPYCPTPQDQAAEASCTTWATTYAALTIHHALHRNITEQHEVDKIAHSKSFVFNQLCTQDKTCTPSVEETFNFLRTHGACLAATFRNDVPSLEKPDNLAQTEAHDFTIDAAIEVFDPDVSIPLTRQILRLKRLIADSTPIVVGLRVPYSFYNLSQKKFAYNPNEPRDSAAHAVCLIGYDDVDSTFDILNSWGTGWGDGGFARLRYADLIGLMCCAYRLSPSFVKQKKDDDILRGAVVLRRALRYNERLDPQFEEVRVKYDAVQHHYTTVRQDWKIGAGFQLTLRQMPLNWWVYVFGINPKGEPFVFFQNKIGEETLDKVVPADGSQLELEGGGAEFLGVVCSQAPLSNFSFFLQKLPKTNAVDFQKKLVARFEKVVSNKVLSTNDRMGFSFSKNTPIHAALLLLKMEGK